MFTQKSDLGVNKFVCWDGPAFEAVSDSNSLKKVLAFSSSQPLVVSSNGSIQTEAGKTCLRKEC